MTFTFNSNGKCPKCSNSNFISDASPSTTAQVKCSKCGNLTTVDKAIQSVKAA